MKLSNNNSITSIREQATARLEQASALEKLMEIDLPGEFVFSPPEGNRLSVSDMEELHEARSVLRKLFKWRDSVRNKFYSSGQVIVVYAHEYSEGLPLPFEIWVQAEINRFPQELLGKCKLIPREVTEYNVVCEI